MRRSPPWHLWPLVLLAVLAALPEAVLTGADLGLWGSARWRPMAYAQGAFWAGLLHGWTPNYPAQPWLMFLTHAWLHAGPEHLAGNLAALAWLGPGVLARAGGWGLALLWLLAVLGGAAAFGLLTGSPAPMVGASGGLFGLAGAAVVWHARATRAAGAGRGRALALGLGGLAGLLLLNALAWVLAGGLLAWETHLGGLLAGATVAAAWRGLRP